MNKLLFIFFISPFLLNAQNQNFNTKNTIPSLGDLQATYYKEDTLANAIYIFEEGFSEIDKNRGYDLVTAYSAKIKIFNNKGFEEATIEIPLRKNDHSQEKVVNLKASTYNLENGKQIKKTLNPNKLYTKEYEEYDLLKFTFPHIKPGSVLVYSYELISPFIFDFTTWKFQAHIPKAYSRFTAKIPANYEYYITKRGALELKTDTINVVKRCISFGGNSKPGDCLKMVYDMENIPAFKSEEYLTSERNYMSRIEFELSQVTKLDGHVEKYTKTWDDVDKELEKTKGIGRQLKKDQLVDEILPDKIKSMPNNMEKARSIYNYVQQRYTWNEEYNIHGDMNIKNIIEDRTGNVLEINTLLHNLYDSEDFKVLPVMAATRKKGFPSKVHPVLSDFNYFFIQLEVGRKKYLLDASDKNLDFGRLPYRALNGNARLMDFENGSSWIDIVPKNFSRLVFQDSLKIRPNGTATGFSRQILNGYHALNYRNHLAELNDNEIFNKISNPNEQTRAGDIKISYKEDKSKDLEIKYILDNKSQKINDRIYFNPFSFKFFSQNPFKQEERNYPIDFGYKDAYMYSAIIEIPAGYKVAELPQTKQLRLQGKGGSLIFTANQTGENIINVQCRLSFPHAVYPPEYYEGLKQFFDQIMEVQQQSLIVLEENS